MKKQLIENLLNKHNTGKQFPISYESFVENAQRYIKAVKERRMMCSIGSVSQPGMSRTMKFFEMQKNGRTKTYSVLNFYQLFDILGHSKVRDSDYFRIHGCSMDMVFSTNYNNIHELHYLGFITKKTCDTLAQETPHVV